MGWFQDDFYSTKVPRWPRRGRRRGSGSRWPRRGGGSDRQLALLLGGAVAVGVLLTLLVLPLVHALGGGGGGATAAKPANDPVVAAVDKVGTTVVSVISVFQDKGAAQPKGMGLGSGVIFQKEGGKARVVTNNHVVQGGSSFEVVLSNGEHRKATVVGSDWQTDLAVLEIDGSGIGKVAEFGDSDALKRGEKAIAIGSPLGFAQTITVGVISSPLQTITVPSGPNGDVESEMDVIQTDAAINEGNSGGALVTLDGKVVGINSMKIAETGVEGLGFAIPINEAQPIIQALLKDHKVRRPYMGITPTDLQSFSSGTEVLKLPDTVKDAVVVIDVTGPAKDAGLQSQDVIVELDGQPIGSAAALRKYLYTQKKIGDKLSVTYYRGGKKMTATVVLGELPSQ